LGWFDKGFWRRGGKAKPSNSIGLKSIGDALLTFEALSICSTVGKLDFRLFGMNGLFVFGNPMGLWISLKAYSATSLSRFYII